MKIGKRGFTLIELLAALVILGLLMVVAIPSINTILRKNKDKLYVEDAKKLIAVADYKIRNTTDANIKKPKPDECTAMDLSYLDNGDFNDPPYGGAYYAVKSFVVVCNTGDAYEYHVQLLECKKVDYSNCSGDYCKCNEDGGRRGTYMTTPDTLNDPDAKMESFIGDDYMMDPLGFRFYTSGGIKNVHSKVYDCSIDKDSWLYMENFDVLYDPNDK